MITKLKDLFFGKKPAPVTDRDRAIEIISEALWMISPELWFGTLKLITEAKFPEFRVCRKRHGNKKSDAKGGEATTGTKSEEQT